MGGEAVDRTRELGLGLSGYRLVVGEVEARVGLESMGNMGEKGGLARLGPGNGLN